MMTLMVPGDEELHELSHILRRVRERAPPHHLVLDYMLHVYMYNTCIYIYIYRERERCFSLSLSLSLYICMCVYIYIYIEIYVCVYIYIYALYYIHVYIIEREIYCHIYYILYNPRSCRPCSWRSAPSAASASRTCGPARSTTILYHSTVYHILAYIMFIVW